MKEDPLTHFRDTLLQRPLTPSEEQRLADWLARHPEAIPGWREDAALALGLRRLPPAPVPAHFTARVIAEVQRDRDQHRPSTFPLRWPAWLMPRAWMPVGFATAVAVLSIAGWQWRTARQQAEDARNLAPLRALAAMPPEVLQDFDAIRRLGAGSPAVDFELLAVLQ